MQVAISPELKRPDAKINEIPPRTPTLAHHGNQIEDDDGSHMHNPSDFNCTAYVLMTILGLGLLMPWNIVLLALDYFTEEYPGSGISFYLSIAYIYPQLPMLGVVMTVGENFSFGARILSTYVGQAVVLVMLPFIAQYSVWVTLGTVLFIGVCTSIQQPSLFGLSSLYPQIYNTGLMSGQGVAGIFASILRIVTKITLPTEHKKSAYIYFITAGVSLVVCSVCYLWLVSLPFSQRYLSEVENKRAKALDAAQKAGASSAGLGVGHPQGGSASSRSKSPMSSPLLEGESGDARRRGSGAGPRSGLSAMHYHAGGRESPGAISMTEYQDRKEGGFFPETDSDATAVVPQGSSSSAAASAPREQSESNSLLGSNEDATCTGRWQALWRVTVTIWPMMFAIMFVFVATFFVFPGEVVAVKYQGTVGLHGLAKADWWPVVLLTAFQIGDTTGRSLPAVVTCVTRTTLPWASLARILFVPLWIVAARALPVVSSDPWTLVLMLLFSLSNGYVSTLAFAYAPRMVEPVDREKVGFLMGLILQVGIASGSALALALK